MTRGTLHHLEIWVADLQAAKHTWGWLLTALGYQAGDEWAGGRSTEADVDALVHAASEHGWSLSKGQTGLSRHASLNRTPVTHQNPDS